MYLVTMEDDHGMWMDDPEAYDGRKEALSAAAKMADRFKRQATVYKCDLYADVEPEKPEAKADAPS